MKVEAPCSCTMKILGFLFLIVVPCRKKEEKKSLSVRHLLSHFPECLPLMAFKAETPFHQSFT